MTMTTMTMRSSMKVKPGRLKRRIVVVSRV